MVETRGAAAPINEEEQIARSYLLSGVSQGDIRFLMKRCPVRDIEPGEILISAGDVNYRMYLLLSGRLTVHLVTPDNDPVADVKPGESVGELSLIDKSPRSAYVIASVFSRALEVDDETFWMLVRSSPAVATNLLTVLARRLRGNNDTITATRRLQEEYKRTAAIDGLTGLYNRRWLDEMLPRFVARAEKSKRPLCVIMTDVDHFKRCNDTYGHPAGDFVLFAVAKVLRAQVRPTDVPVRYGGEEFTVILPETAEDKAYLIGERLRKAVSEFPLVLPDQKTIPSVTVSVGLAEVRPTDDVATLVGRADAALYKAKREGRNRTCM